MGELVLDILEDGIDDLVAMILKGFDEVPLPADVAPYESRRFAVALRHAQGGVEGGITGHSVWGWLYVSYLWVSETHQGDGWGQRLLDAAERIAEDRGCQGVWLHTISFQAPAFYERQGYETFGELPDFPKGYRRIFYRKFLNAGAAR